MPQLRLRNIATQKTVFAGDTIYDKSNAAFILDSWGPGAEVYVVRIGVIPKRKIRAGLHEFNLEIFTHG